MKLFTITTVIVGLVIATATLYYQRKQTRGGKPEAGDRSSTAFTMVGNEKVTFIDNKSYGYDQLAELNNNGEVDVRDNEAHR